MIYIADGPSDVPSFSVVKSNGGKAYGVYNPARSDEFAQNDRLRQAGRIDHYGAAEYSRNGNTGNWLELQIHQIADRIATNREILQSQITSQPPKHLNSRDSTGVKNTNPTQKTFLD
jgi:hypothetical protein